MRIKITIRCPKGRAKSVDRDMRRMVCGWNTPVVTEIVEKDNEDNLIWRLEADSRRLAKIARNVSMFHGLMHNVVNIKAVRKLIDKSLNTQEEKDLLIDMLTNQTEMDIEYNPKEAS